MIGTEVPPPGGEMNEGVQLRVTSPQDVEETLEFIRRAFARRGLEAAWERVVSLVVQPGVDFTDGSVREYQRDRAEPLSRFITYDPRLVYEAHSTDYQKPGSLRQLVEDHFAILKVGPALTFAFRKAAFALAWMEQKWLASRSDAALSDLPTVMNRAMLADRVIGPAAITEVQAALTRLFANLERGSPPLTLLSQFLPEQYARVRGGRLGRRPREWVSDRVAAVLRTYARACGTGIEW